MISFWKDPKEIHTDDGLIIIIGWYNHKNKNKSGAKSLGVHWKTFPQSRGILSPCVIPESTRNAILSGLLHQAMVNKESKQINSITEAIEFLNN